MKCIPLCIIVLAVVTVGCAADQPEVTFTAAGEDAETNEKECAPVLTDQDKEYLVNLARQTLSWHLKEGVQPRIDESLLSDAVKQRLGCFVTLDKKGRGLRGCIGIFERNEPLYKNVMSRVIAAAIYDSRFPKVTQHELKDIKIEISVLTAPERLAFSSPDDLINRLRPLVDGVILNTRYGSSTYLPQVWEQLPEKKIFLSSLCRKHGAPPDAWVNDSKNLQVETYQAIVFGEEEYGRQVAGRKGATVGVGKAFVVGVDAVHAKAATEGEVEAGVFLEPGTVVSAASDITDL